MPVRITVMRNFFKEISNYLEDQDVPLATVEEGSEGKILKRIMLG